MSELSLQQQRQKLVRSSSTSSSVDCGLKALVRSCCLSSYRNARGLRATQRSHIALPKGTSPSCSRKFRLVPPELLSGRSSLRQRSGFHKGRRPRPAELGWTIVNFLFVSFVLLLTSTSGPTVALQLVGVTRTLGALSPSRVAQLGTGDCPSTITCRLSFKCGRRWTALDAARSPELLTASCLSTTSVVVGFLPSSSSLPSSARLLDPHP